MRCQICREEIAEKPLGKISGTYIYLDGRRFVICSACQRRLGTRKDKLKKFLQEV